jgi:hypothetical protein
MFMAGEARLSAELSGKQSNFFSIGYDETAASRLTPRARVNVGLGQRPGNDSLGSSEDLGSLNVFSAAVSYPISLTPRFSEVYGYPLGDNQLLERTLAKPFRIEMIANTMSAFTEQINRALSDGKLRDDAAENIRKTLAGAESDFVARVIGELIDASEWEELNDRFYKTLAFGTGGLRGRTIGKVVTKAERGTPDALGRPEFPCVGTNAMNYFNVARATRGLVSYIQKWHSKQRGIGVQSVEGQSGLDRWQHARSKIVIAHDTRHFSKEFARLAAETAAIHGCDAVIFEGPRSTPELSFAVRYLRADAGVVITASHNPPHDNGYKVYFSDGAQVVEPHASS